MIWEIVHETGFYNHVKTSNIILFNEDAEASDGSGFTTDFLGDHLPSTAQSALQIELTSPSVARRSAPLFNRSLVFTRHQ